MKRLLCALLLTFAFGISLWAQNKKSEDLFDECQDHFYNGEYQDANQCFDHYIALAPDDPRGYWRKAYSLFFQWKSVQHTPFPKLAKPTRDDFFRLIEQGIAHTDGSDFGLYVKACLLSMRGGIEFNNVGKLKAKDTLKDDVLVTAAQSHYQDARYLIGLTNYNGAANRFWFFLAGLPRDRDVGLSQIFQATAKNQGPFVDDIWFALFAIETDKKNAGIFNKEETNKIFRDLYQKYPRNKALQEYAKKDP